MISVLIPARNEFLLGKTIDSILESAEGEIEIIAVLDGYWPEPIRDDPKVTLIHHTNPIGQRAAVNEAARIAKGEYILKTDAHSIFDKGFDIKLAADCEYDWTVIPRMYNLHAFNWVCGNGHKFYQDKFRPEGGKCKDCDKPVKIEWVWEKRAHKKTDFMYMDSKLKVQYWYKYAKRKESKDDIVDIMNGVGACWFQYKERFWELGGLDEEHGSWGQVGVEVACKAWLSGGRHVTNKKTWFAHMFRTTKEFTFPYEVKVKQQNLAREYSRDLWLNGKWPLAKRPFRWLLEKFQPIPSWEPVKLEKTPLLSVIIPARNEKYLQRTIDDCLKKLKTDFEIIVGCDGYNPELKKDSRVVLCHSEKRIGMRPMINKMVNTAKGKYVMRLDAHCIVAEGIDEELIKCHEPGNTVLAMRYELKSSNWTRREKTDCPYRYLSHHSIDPKGLSLRGLAWPEWAESHKNEQVGETMTISGSNWLMEREQFLKWGGMDEKHGTFGQEGVEISCMTWLSGGKVLVNKNTWYAHWNRGKSSYSLGANEKKKSYKRSVELWVEDNWPHAKRKFQWLIDHFSPVLGWEKVTAIYITANKELEQMADVVKNKLLEANIPIVSVSQKPLDFGNNICVGEVGRSSQNVLRQFLIGAEKATTKYVAMAQADCLYPPDYFGYIPPKDNASYFYNNVWRLDSENGRFAPKKTPPLCVLYGNREHLIERVKESLDGKPEWSDKLEHGTNRPVSLKNGDWETFTSEKPVIQINHDKGMHWKYLDRNGKGIEKLPYWGDGKKLNRELGFTKESGSSSLFALMGYRYVYGYQFRKYKVNDIWDNFINHYHPEKRDPKNPRGFYEFVKTFKPFVESVLSGVVFTEDDLFTHPYFGYLEKHLHPGLRNPLTPKGKIYVIKKMLAAWNLCIDIRDNGISTPIDIYKLKEERIIVRGNRRIVILKCLGCKAVIARVFDSLERFKRRRSSLDVRGDGRIEKLAIKQFQVRGRAATDKYWKHNYTHYYDSYMSGLYNKPLKILEIGVLRGASLLLWKGSFPKAQIFGLDIKDLNNCKNLRKNKDIKLFVGDQGDTEFLKEVGKSGPYDLIVDDGSHKPTDQLTSFCSLWPCIAKGGSYVVEDVWNGTKYEKARHIITNKLKDMIDEICTTEDVLSVCFYPNIIFVKKNG